MYKNILVSVDTTDEKTSVKTMSVAAGLAKSLGAKLEAMTVAPEIPYPMVTQYLPEGTDNKLVEDCRTALQALVADHGAGLDVGVHVAQGTIYQKIIGLADKLDSDLIVISSHRPELSDYLIGPNSARVVRHSTRSVLVVRD